MVSQKLHQLAQAVPHKIAFSFKGRDLTSQGVTYAQLDQDARHIAAVILEQNPARKPVYVAMRQSIGFIKVLFGCLYSGITFLPTYPIRNTHDVARLKAITQTVEPALIIVDDVAPLADLQEQLPYTIIPAHHLMGEKSLAKPEVMAECALLQCSSGTTRSPKAIQVTTSALMACLENMKQHFQITADDIGCSWLPPYHDMGLIGGILLPVYAEFTTHLMSPSSFMMNPLGWLEYISSVRATISVAPNIAFDLCVRRIKSLSGKLDLSCLRILVNSAQMTQPRTLDDFVKTFKPHGLNSESLMNAYGLAEATLMVTCTQPCEATNRHEFHRLSLRKGIVIPESNVGEQICVASCGRPIQGMDIKIVDRYTGALMPPDSVGEIWVSGNSIAGGYYQNDDVTREVFGRTIAGRNDPYISTGDTGFISADGLLFVTGRIKDSIKMDNGLVSAEEIEEIIESQDYQDPSYRCAALLVARHDGAEIVVLREVDRTIDPVAHGSQMLYLLRKHYMIKVNKIIYMRRGTIPTTTSGKVKRHAAIVLYLHDLLDPIYEYSFDPALDLLELQNT